MNKNGMENYGSNLEVKQEVNSAVYRKVNRQIYTEMENWNQHFLIIPPCSPPCPEMIIIWENRNKIN